eukprot:COSAG05_NODE_90_length_20140_cov_25.117060_16_plen_331_part_00
MLRNRMHSHALTPGTLFRHMDADRNDHVSVGEFNGGLKSAGIHMSSPQAKMLFNVHDINNNGRVSWNEMKMVHDPEVVHEAVVKTAASASGTRSDPDCPPHSPPDIPERDHTPKPTPAPSTPVSTPSNSNRRQPITAVVSSQTRRKVQRAGAPAPSSGRRSAAHARGSDGQQLMQPKHQHLQSQVSDLMRQRQQSIEALRQADNRFSELQESHEAALAHADVLHAQRETATQKAALLEAALVTQREELVAVEQGHQETQNEALAEHTAHVRAHAAAIAEAEARHTEAVERHQQVVAKLSAGASTTLALPLPPLRPLSPIACRGVSSALVH